ncbi:MAG: MFS transporter [Candidatus Eremiobacteraeota bacterium]|nr:MFS transporter [Candidatus Eremiobacteraeota bacterium]
MKKDNLFALSIFWFAWEVHWAALLGAAMQGQIARFEPPDLIGRATAVLAGSGAVFSILSQYASGKLSDQRGRRIPFMLAGTLLDIVALFGFALSPSFLAVVLTFIGVQVSLNAACGPYQALMPDRVALAARGRASAVMGLFRLAGTAAGLFTAKLFVHQPGPHVTSAMFTSGLLHLAAVIAVVLLIALAITAIGVSDRQQPKQTAASVDAPWPARSSFGWLILSRALVNMGLYSILPFLAFYLRFAQHVTNYLSTSLDLLLVMIGCALVGTVPAGIAGDRWPKKTILYAALGLLAAGAASLSFISGASKLLPLAILLGLGWGAYYSVDWALACVLLPAGRAGALMAIWNIGASAPQVAAPIVGGLLVDQAGALSGDLGLGYRLLFGVVAVFVMLGAAGLMFVREPRAGLTAQTG